MDILPKSIERYLDRLVPASDPLLAEMEARARREKIPIIGPAVGHLLALLVELSAARRIFEMGSAIGYSTIWLARAAGPAEVHYTDADPARVEAAREYLRRAGLTKRIHMHAADALRALDETRGAFDLIFVDLDKPSYPAAFRKAVPRLRRGGLLVADNVLWHGRVAGRASDPSTRAVREFNRLLYSSREIFPVIVPLRDGVAVARKR
jgi:caffeoyl-CoA O-methyltransferase